MFENVLAKVETNFDFFEFPIEFQKYLFAKQNSSNDFGSFH